MKTILITGATGLIGQEIVKQCHDKKWVVHFLTTSRSKVVTKENYKGFYWNPTTGKIDIEAFNNVDSIINLAGAPIAKRWTVSYKKEIVDSRVEALTLLFDTISKNNISIKHLVSASAIGYYPSSLINYYDEAYEADEHQFIINVVKQWEAAADRFNNLDILVSKIRIGLVLSDKGGALPKIVKPINNFIGAPIASGNQWQSWIHITDLSRLFIHVLEYQLLGIYNGVAPNPVTQRSFTKIVAKALNKPLLLPNVPAFLLRLLLGEMSSLIIEGQRVSSRKIEQTGFHFNYVSIDQALEELL